MTDLVIRKIPWEFDADVPFRWQPANPNFGIFCNAFTFIAVPFEKYIIASLRQAQDRLDENPDVAAEAEAFLRQEAQHAAAHRKHMLALIARYPELEECYQETVHSYDRLLAAHPVEYHAAYVANLEATFTPTFKMMLDNEDTLFAPGDDRVASLFLWHFVEEVEHRSSALVIYDAAVGDSWYRIRALPAVMRHLTGVMRRICEGVNTHVPEADRKLDALTMIPVAGVGMAVRRRLRGHGPATPGAFAAVPRGELITAFSRVLLSQTPFHHPEHEPLPRFADVWFARWTAGADVTRWYRTESAAQ